MMQDSDEGWKGTQPSIGPEIPEARQAFDAVVAKAKILDALSAPHVFDSAEGEVAHIERAEHEALIADLDAKVKERLAIIEKREREQRHALHQHAAHIARAAGGR